MRLLSDDSLVEIVFQPCCCTLLQHPCPTRIFFRSDSRRDSAREQVLELRLAFSGWPCGPAPLRVGPRPDEASPAPRAGSGHVSRDRFTLCAVTSTVTPVWT